MADYLHVQAILELGWAIRLHATGDNFEFDLALSVDQARKLSDDLWRAAEKADRDRQDGRDG